LVATREQNDTEQADDTGSPSRRATLRPTRGYGFDYLDVIRDVFTDAAKAHVDLAPADVGRACDSWYLTARKTAQAVLPEADSWTGAALSCWHPMMGLAQAGVQGDTLRGVSNTSDPAWQLSEMRLRASRYRRWAVEMKLSRPGTAQLFWTTSSEPSTSEAASTSVPFAGDGQFHTYLFEVGQNDHWGGCITSLRFDPTGEPDVSVEIRAIRLE